MRLANVGNSSSLSPLATLLSASPAHAWGCKGHETVALIAEKHLSPEAKEFVLALLKENPIDPQFKRYCGSAVNDPMGDASTWADDIRNERHNGPWHYIDIPRGVTAKRRRQSRSILRQRRLRQRSARRANRNSQK